MGASIAFILLVIGGGVPAQAENAAAQRKQAVKRPATDRPDHNYQNFLPKGRTVTLPVKIEDLKHFQVYRTASKRQWSCWTRVWFTPKGHIRVSFYDMSGGPADLKPGYGYEYAPADVLEKQGITRCHRWVESRDGGVTWRAIRQIDTSDPMKPQSDSYLTLKDGTLLGIGGVWAGWDFEKKTYKRVGHTMAWTSSNGSETWRAPTSLNDPKQMLSFSCRPKQLRDGTIVLPSYGTFDRGKPSPNTDAWLWFSKDGGRRWSAPLLLVRGTPTRTNDEPEIAELANGDLLVVLRHSNPKAKGAALYLACGQMVVKKSPSGWQVGPWRSTHMGFRGFPALLRTRDDILICAGSGNQFNFSIDEGKTWSATASLVDPAIDRHNHYPTLTEMPDGRVLSVYHVGNHWPYPPPKEEWIHATSFRVKR